MARRFGSTYTYVLTDEGINVHTRVTNLDVSWDAITKVRESSRYWFLRFAGGGVATLPKADFPPSDEPEFRAFLAGRRLIRA